MELVVKNYHCEYVCNGRCKWYKALFLWEIVTCRNSVLKMIHENCVRDFSVIQKYNFKQGRNVYVILVVTILWDLQTSPHPEILLTKA